MTNITFQTFVWLQFELLAFVITFIMLSEMLIICFTYSYLLTSTFDVST